MAVHVKEPRRGSFADGQAARPRADGAPGRFSCGQERAPLRAAAPTGWFAEGQALSQPAAAPRGRFCTGQERGQASASAGRRGG